MSGTASVATRPGLPQQAWAIIANRSVRGRAEALLAVLDGLLVVVAYTGFLLVWHDLDVPAAQWAEFRVFAVLAVAGHLAANWVAGLYGPMWQHASMREARQVIVGGFAATLALSPTVLLLPTELPFTVVFLGGIAATLWFGAVRFQSRLFAFRRDRTLSGTRVVVVGAGRSAAAILREVSRHPNPGVRPVALVDDDPTKVGRRLNGVPIAGTIADLARVCEGHDAVQILLAIPSADAAMVQRVADVAGELQLSMKMVPGVGELVNGTPRLRDIRDLAIDDILGRQQIDTDLAAVHRLLANKRVLITGGGGSIGSEIARQVSQFAPEVLAVLDRDETHLFDAAAVIDTDIELVLADITDVDQLRRVFDEVQPDVVFHAAAHKHVPLLEDHPCQAAGTNVLGTANVLDAARRTGVERLVFVSTDKAVRPANVMGASKRIGEQLVLAGRPQHAAWSAVRFGNVLGSRGSVVPTFMRQIREGGPVTVTHPDMTRFFMSIPEAVQLVLQSATMATGGEIFMLDMGEPVRIMDLARRMITLSGQRPDVDVEVRVTGLRPGEKLAEELSTPEEAAEPTAHPKVTRLRPPLLADGLLAEALTRLRCMVGNQDDEAARDLLFEVAGDPRTVQRGAGSGVLALSEDEATTAA